MTLTDIPLDDMLGFYTTKEFRFIDNSSGTSEDAIVALLNNGVRKFITQMPLHEELFITILEKTSFFGFTPKNGKRLVNMAIPLVSDILTYTEQADLYAYLLRNMSTVIESVTDDSGHTYESADLSYLFKEVFRYGYLEDWDAHGSLMSELVGIFPGFDPIYLEQVQNIVGEDVRNMVPFIGGRNSLAVYSVDSDLQSYVVKIADKRKIKLEYEVLLALGNSCLKDIFPKVVVGSYTKLGDHALLIMDDLSQRLSIGESEDFVENNVRNTARFHYYGKQILTSDFIRKLTKEGILGTVEFGTKEEIESHVDELRRKNQERYSPIDVELLDIALLELQKSTELIPYASEFVVAFSEWGLAHKDLIPTNTTKKGHIFDLGNCALAPLIFDLTRYLGQLQTLTGMSLTTEQAYIGIYRDERQKLDPAYADLFPYARFKQEYDCAKFIDNNRLSHCCAIDVNGGEHMDPIFKRAIALRHSQVYNFL